MDLFYRGFDEDSRITSAMKHLAAAGARIAVSMLRSIPHLPDAVWEQFRQMLTISTLWSLGLVLAGWLIATVIGGAIGLAVNSILILFGLIELWEQFSAIGTNGVAWLKAAYFAETDADLDQAGKHFAAVLSQGGLAVLEIVVTHRVFRSVNGRLRERFPTPDWLKQQFDDVTQKRTAQMKGGLTAQLARNKNLPAVKATSAIVRTQGAQHVSREFPTAAVVAGGAALAVGTVAIVAWASTKTSRSKS